MTPSASAIDAARQHIQHLRDGACRAREVVDASEAQIVAEQANNARLIREADIADAAATLFERLLDREIQTGSHNGQSLAGRIAEAAGGYAPNLATAEPA